MKTFVVPGMLALLAMPALAQDEQPPDSSDMMVRMFGRMLNLTEEQTEKAREIFKKQNEQLRGILDDQQKERFDSMGRMMGGGRSGRGGGPGGGSDRGGRGGGRGGPGGSMRSGIPSTDELKEQLGLSDEQVEQITKLRDGLREESREKMREFFQSRPSREQMTEFFQKMRDESIAKVRDVLTDEQKPKFDELVQKAQAEANERMERMRSGFSRSPEDRANRIMEALNIENKEEAEAIKGLVVNVIEIQQKLETYNREARGALEDIRRDTEMSDEAVGQKLGEILKGRDPIEKELEAARKELSEVVTYRQELELIRARILR